MLNVILLILRYFVWFFHKFFAHLCALVILIILLQNFMLYELKSGNSDVIFWKNVYTAITTKMDKISIFIVICLFIYELICFISIIAINYPGLSWFVKINACQIRKVAADYSFDYLIYRINRQRLSKIRNEKTTEIFKMQSFVKAHEDLGKEIERLKTLTEELLENSDPELKAEQEIPISTTWSSVPKHWERYKMSRFDTESLEKSFEQFLKKNYGINEGNFYLPTYQPELDENERKKRLLRFSPIERKKRLAKLLATTQNIEYQNDDAIIEQRYQFFLRKLGVKPVPYNTERVEEATEVEPQEDEKQEVQPEDEQELHDEESDEQLNVEEWLKKRKNRRLKRRQFRERYGLNATVESKSPCKLTQSTISADNIPKNSRLNTSEESLVQNTSREYVNKASVPNEYNLPEPMSYGGNHTPHMNDMHYCPIDPNRHCKHTCCMECNNQRCRPLCKENDYCNSIGDEEPVCCSSYQDAYDNLPTQSTHQANTCKCNYYNANYMKATSELEIPENTHNTMPYNGTNPFIQNPCCIMPNKYTDTCCRDYCQSDVGSGSLASNSSLCDSCEQMSANVMPLDKKRLPYSTKPERHNMTDYMRIPETTSSGSEVTRPSGSKKICFYKILRNLRNSTTDGESSDLQKKDEDK